MRTKQRTVAAVLLSGSLLVCVACTSAPEEPQSAREVILSLADKARDEGHTQQVAILEDGDVTKDEHEQAFRDMKACMTEAGIQIGTPEINPVDGYTYLFTIDGPGLDPDVFVESQDACLNSEWNLVDAAYSVTQTPRMDPPLAEATRTCLTDKGYEIEGDASAFNDFAGDPGADNGAQREAAADCVIAQAHIIYPDLQQLAITS